MDTLQYRVELEDRVSYTKRDVLSKISQVFDPLGLIAPVLIVGKIIMQKNVKTSSILGSRASSQLKDDLGKLLQVAYSSKRCTNT